MINSLTLMQVTADTTSVMQKYADKWEANLQAADQAGFMIQLLASNDLIFVVLCVTLIYLVCFAFLYYQNRPKGKPIRRIANQTNKQRR